MRANLGFLKSVNVKLILTIADIVVVIKLEWILFIPLRTYIFYNENNYFIYDFDYECFSLILFEEI